MRRGFSQSKGSAEGVPVRDGQQSISASAAQRLSQVQDDVEGVGRPAVHLAEEEQGGDGSAFRSVSGGSSSGVGRSEEAFSEEQGSGAQPRPDEQA